MSATLDLYETNGSSPPTAELEQQIRRDVLQYVGCRGASVKYAVDAGNGLLKLKESVEHGQWLPALSRCGLAERTAQRFMLIASNPPRVADFSSVRQIEKAIKEARRQEREAALDIAGTAPTDLKTHMVLLDTATSKVGNPSVRPLPVDARSDEERERDEQPKKKAVQPTPADDLEEHLKAWNRAQFDFDEWKRVALEADEATGRALGLLRQILDAFPQYSPNRAGNAPAIEPDQLTSIYREIEKRRQSLISLTSEIDSFSRGEFEGQGNLVYGGSFDAGLKRWANRIRKMQPGWTPPDRHADGQFTDDSVESVRKAAETAVEDDPFMPRKKKS